MKYLKFLLLAIIIQVLFFSSKSAIALGIYSDEGIAFYAQNSTLGYATEGIAFYAYGTQQAETFPVYRFASSKSGDHFYTVNEDEKNAVANNSQWGYASEGIAFYAYASQLAGTLPAYRFVNQITGDHFYTISENEKVSVLNNPQWGYIAEGIAFYVFSQQETATFPVYRFINSSNGDHFYTISENEKNNISQSPVYRFINPKTGDHFYTISESEKNIVTNTSKSGYVAEGIAFYAYTSEILNMNPVYRFVSFKTGDHFYTISQEEKDSLLNNIQIGYSYEGIAFYASATQVTEHYPIYRFVNSTTGDHFYTISESERNYLLTTPLGSEISVGLWGYSKADIQSSPFQIDANKSYNIRNGNGAILAQLSANSTTSVTYDDNGNLEISGSVPSPLIVNSNVTFDSADGDNTSIIFNTHRSDYTNDWRGTIDRYRGKIKVQYYRGPDIVGGNSSSTLTQIWIINILPVEHYTWGAAELYGTGDIDHSKVMVTAFRSFGYRRVQSSTLLYPGYGFRVLSNSSDQNYGGYDWETNWPNVKKAAQETRGVTITYGGSTVVTPYSSWSAGSTRTYGSSRPWCKSVSDSYGNYNDSYWNHSSTKTQEQLIAEGSHMYGLIANGSARLAAKYDWDWQRILKYYYTGIGLTTNY